MDLETPVRIVESETYGRIAIVTVSNYITGESMGQICKRTGSVLVLLVGDGHDETMTVAEIEEALTATMMEAHKHDGHTEH